MKYEWKDEYSVQHPLVDSHHRYLFKLLNQLVDSLEGSADIAVVKTAFEELKNYAVYHFSVEEHLMTEAHSPYLDSHTAEHEAFALKVTALEVELGRDFEKATNGLVQFLSSWLVHHIVKVDKATFSSGSSGSGS